MNLPIPEHESHPVVVAALYQFTDLPRFKELQPPLLDCCESAGIKGTFLLAPEGINGTIAGSRNAIDQVLEFLRAQPEFRDIAVKESRTAAMPFYRMKVRLKKEIVSMGGVDADPRQAVGIYVDPENWNALIQEPDVLLVDARNDYEVEVGTFEGAENPETATFTEFPAYLEKHADSLRHRRVAMFCTGGIRCERATAYLRNLGFDEVYHLEGGILNYLARVPEAESRWRGECFVFDERVTVDHNLEPGRYELCRGCRKPLSEEQRQLPQFIEGVCCHRCHDSLTDEQRRGRAERHRQVELATARNDQHVGKRNPTSQGK